MRCGICLALTAGVAAAEESAVPIFLGIGSLGGGTIYSNACGVSGNGKVVVGSSISLSGSEGCRWVSGVLQNVGDLAGGLVSGVKNAASYNGSTVVGSGHNGLAVATIWTQASGTTALAWTLPNACGGLPYVASAAAYGISWDGSKIIGYINTDCGNQACYWNAAGVATGLGDVAGGVFSSRAYAISADGSTIVGYGTNALGTVAFRWTGAGALTALGGTGDLAGGATAGAAYGVSSNGSVVVGKGVNLTGTWAFRWDSTAGIVSLGDLAGGLNVSTALGVSGDGKKVIGYGTSLLGNEAFIWDSVNGMRDLRQYLIDSGNDAVCGWRLVRAQAISADGFTIVGYGLNLLLHTEGWIVKLPRTKGLKIASWREVGRTTP